MDKKEFGKYFEGYGVTTGKDRHGDVWTKEHLVKIKKDFESHPERKIIPNQHNPKEVIGEILSMKIEEKENGWAGLKIKGGIFKGKEKEFEKMKKEGWGFSIAVLYSNCNLTSEEILNSETKIEVSPYIHREIENVLDSSGFKYGVHLRKGIDFPTIISLVGITLFNLYKLLDLLLKLKEKKDNEKNKKEFMDAINEIKKEIKRRGARN